jgi:8-oxo-dGTP pyrophosphatase MutT (NUDIX family)
VRRRKVQVLLVTSRGTGRWIVPKGWPLPGKPACDTAQTEAFEEAGVIGKVRDLCLGLYAYDKDADTAEPVACMVALYPLEVEKLARKFPERGERKRKWMSRKRAAALVAEPELARLIAGFDPKTAEGGA